MIWNLQNHQIFLTFQKLILIFHFLCEYIFHNWINSSGNSSYHRKANEIYAWINKSVSSRESFHGIRSRPSTGEAARKSCRAFLVSAIFTRTLVVIVVQFFETVRQMLLHGMLDGKKRHEAMSTSLFKYSCEVFVHAPSGVSTGTFSLWIYTYVRGKRNNMERMKRNNS